MIIVILMFFLDSKKNCMILTIFRRIEKIV